MLFLAVESDDDDDEDDNEGISRISEALQAHMWPQITLKGSNKGKGSDIIINNKPMPLLCSSSSE